MNSRCARFLTSATVLALVGCGGDEAMVGAMPAPAASATPTPTAAGSLGADGWASTSGGTTGGNGATAAKTYTVTNRNQLIQALYGNTATIAADGGVTAGTLDPDPKIIYVRGTISLNVNQALVEQSADDYVRASCAATRYGYADEAALWSAYYAAYRPAVWGNATTVSGTPESARACAADAQKKAVRLYVPSNTSIIGLGGDARITHGNLVLGTSAAPVDNIVVRNVTFEDAFDFFPEWDPTDSTTGRWNSAYDLISVMYATHVWIDHSTFSDGSRLDKSYPSVWTETVKGVDYRGSDFKVQHHDGLVDITKLGNLVTISNSLFFNHDKSFLIGGTDTASRTAENPSVLKVTFHDNYFRGLRQRQPRVRFGQVHVYNNYYEGTLDSAADYPWLVGWTVGQSGKIYAENNVFQIAGGASVTNLWSVSVSASRTNACVALGYTSADCAATFVDSGTVLNGVAVDAMSSLVARYPAVSGTSWRPILSYAYSPKSTTGLSAQIIAEAGAGKL